MVYSHGGCFIPAAPPITQTQLPMQAPTSGDTVGKGDLSPPLPQAQLPIQAPTAWYTVMVGVLSPPPPPSHKLNFRCKPQHQVIQWGRVIYPRRSPKLNSRYRPQQHGIQSWWVFYPRRPPHHTNSTSDASPNIR